MYLTNKFLCFSRIKINNSQYIQCFSSEVYKNQILRVLFFGTDNFSLPSLQILNENLKSKKRIELAVVTSIKTPANPVQRFAELEEIKIFNWPINNNNKYDIGVVVSFGYMIPARVINSFPLGMINVHASLLPKYRGAAPIIYSILNGDKKTGVSIMKIRPHHFDIGEIITQQEIEIPPKILMPDLHKILADAGSELLLQCINNLPGSLDNAKSQSEEGVSYAPKVQHDLTKIDWNSMTGMQIFNLYRALYSYKFVTTRYHGQIVKLIKIDFENLSKCNHMYSPGTIIYSKKDKFLKVYCINGEYIKVYQLQVEKKKVMSVLEFINGFVKKKSKEEHFFD